MRTIGILALLFAVLSCKKEVVAPCWICSISEVHYSNVPGVAAASPTRYSQSTCDEAEKNKLSTPSERYLSGSATTSQRYVITTQGVCARSN